ncbi:hypothetical protein J2Z49_001137 [Desulfofundulus luciae]|uniref:Uncharacterized protein n=1 Tax=Desulfofundulus luciae TaxID=74702 RepID=A0ABU0AZZ3_9FIRM|nr:hypothetical protein [Desulfofundulus luciae]MDQ0286031.1 hypothetical protein [Desulfofundulus luciae]
MGTRQAAYLVATVANRERRSRGNVCHTHHVRRDLGTESGLKCANCRPDERLRVFQVPRRSLVFAVPGGRQVVLHHRFRPVRHRTPGCRLATARHF